MEDLRHTIKELQELQRQNALLKRELAKYKLLTKQQPAEVKSRDIPGEFPYVDRKKILYLDMDGVVADFDRGIKKFAPDLHTGDNYPDPESRRKKVDKVCESNPDIFHYLLPIPGAVEAVKVLFEIFDVYFLSTAMWNVPDSFTGKRIWIEKHFGKSAEKRLILTHRKDLAIGDILVDDRLKNGAGEFKGLHIHFGTERFPNWSVVLPLLVELSKM